MINISADVKYILANALVQTYLSLLL